MSPGQGQEERDGAADNEPAMIPLADFAGAAATTWRRRLLLVRVFFVSFFFSLVCVIVFAIWLQPAVEWTLKVATPFVLVWIFGGWLWLWWCDATPRCPYCGKNNSSNAAWTIATRNCGGCGRRILAEPQVGDLDADSRLLPEEFNSWLRRSGMAGLLAWVFQPNPYGSVVHWGGKPDRVGRCPFCEGALHEMRHSCLVVIVTGNCGHCGRQIITEVPRLVADGRPPNGELPTLDAFCAACRSWSKMNMAFIGMCAIGLMVGIVTGGLLIIWLTGSTVTIDPQWYHFTVAIAPMLMMAAMMIYVGIKIERRDRRRYCPNCKADLVRDGGHAVIASRRCQRCLQRVIAEPN